MANSKLLMVGVAALACGVWASAVQSATVAPGFDLLLTIPGTTGPGGEKRGTWYEGTLPGIGDISLPMQGAPELVGAGICSASNHFNFGSGCVNVGATDAILHRKEAATGNAGDTAEIDIEFVALALRSVNPVSLPNSDGGTNTSYLFARILQYLPLGQWIYGQDDGSTMKITFTNDDGGTFTSNLKATFNLFDDDGLLGLTDSLNMLQDSAIWQRDPTVDAALKIASVNWLMNGANNDADFWPGPARHCDINKCHETIVTPVPAALPLLASALLGLGVFRRMRQRRQGAAA